MRRPTEWNVVIQPILSDKNEKRNDREGVHYGQLEIVDVEFEAFKSILAVIQGTM